MSNNETSDCGCTGDTQRAGADPAYRRALWIVVLLNLGFGVFEAFGGFLADSQALKADALDFIGDGSITLIGILALAWTARTRARVALAQGLFLGVLGLVYASDAADELTRVDTLVCRMRNFHTT